MVSVLPQTILKFSGLKYPEFSCISQVCCKPSRQDLAIHFSRFTKQPSDTGQNGLEDPPRLPSQVGLSFSFFLFKKGSLLALPLGGSHTATPMELWVQQSWPHTSLAHSKVTGELAPPHSSHLWLSLVDGFCLGGRRRKTHTLFGAWPLGI